LKLCAEKIQRLMKNRTYYCIAILCLWGMLLAGCEKENTPTVEESIPLSYVNEASDTAAPDEPPINNDGIFSATAASITAGTRKNLLFNFTTEPTNAFSYLSYTSPAAYGSLQKYATYSINRVNTVARTGSYSARYELRKSDGLVGFGKRSEALRYSKSEPVVKVERWYASSYYLPGDYITDAAPECVTQWHTNIGSPPLSLWTQNGQWRITRFGNKQTIVGNYTKNKWTDFVFHVKWSTGSDGLIEAWKDGIKVLTFTGATILTGTSYGAYMRTGLYKWPWNPTSSIASSTLQRVLYVDDVRIGNANATYYDVAPGNY
jgi:hypothetical protein